MLPVHAGNLYRSHENELQAIAVVTVYELHVKSLGSFSTPLVVNAIKKIPVVAGLSFVSTIFSFPET